MIIEYYRPQTVEEALALIQRENPVTLPMGGGSALSQPSAEPIAVVDLQALGLNQLHRRGHLLELGATMTLQQLSDALGELSGDGDGMVPALLEVIRREATHNLRQVATVAGTLVAADGRSPFTTALLALDAALEARGGASGASAVEQVSLGDLLPMRAEALKGRLIVGVRLSLNLRLAYEYVARTPSDWPLVCAAAARWPSGRTRVALGGYGKAPILAMDGPQPEGAGVAAGSAYRDAADEWASAEYRQEIAATLTRRCLAQLA
ncbi:MAG: hypothetical protein EHM70_19025 [Chloroflexota bacterium]|nr:MAG: hypothetical protein EHM70_19025 [Chloroflexota bacterium]